MSKELFFGDECSDKLLSGAKKLADAVKITLGPCGKLVAFTDASGKPLLTKDGVTVAKQIELKDNAENMGAKLMYEAAAKTNTAAGDNTTTSTVLAWAMVQKGQKAINSGVQPLPLKSGMGKMTKAISGALTELSKKVETAEDITNVATISANNDPEIGKILAEAVEKVGKDGVITVEESKSMETTVKLAEGLQFDNGYINNYFVTNRERMTAEYDDSMVLITDNKISSIKQILTLLNSIGPTGKPLTIICDDMDGDALGTLILNQIRGSLKTLVVKAPSYGENRKAMLEDMAILTGTKVISDDNGTRLEDVKISDLGKAKVKSTKNNTTITAPETTDAVKARIDELKSQIAAAEDEYIKSKLNTRLARLTSKVAVVSIGGATETEIKEKKYRVEDTIAATRAALEEGVVAGGGVALVNAGAFSNSVKEEFSKLSGDEKIGATIILDAIKEPLIQIVGNSGRNGEVVLEHIYGELSAKGENGLGYGYDVKLDRYGNMFDFGIIDTTKAIREALFNATSIATMLLMTDCAIVDIPEKQEPQIAMPMTMGY